MTEILQKGDLIYRLILPFPVQLSITTCCNKPVVEIGFFDRVQFLSRGFLINCPFARSKFNREISKYRIHGKIKKVVSRLSRDILN